jgi:hypothetical protein
MNVLVVDAGGTHVKILATGEGTSRMFPSGPRLTAKQMVSGVKKLARGWEYRVLSIGYPGRFSIAGPWRNHITSDPGGSVLTFERHSGARSK